MEGILNLKVFGFQNLIQKFCDKPHKEGSFTAILVETWKRQLKLQKTVANLRNLKLNISSQSYTRNDAEAMRAKKKIAQISAMIKADKLSVDVLVSLLEKLDTYLADYVENERKLDGTLRYQEFIQQVESIKKEIISKIKESMFVPMAKFRDRLKCYIELQKNEGTVFDSTMLKEDFKVIESNYEYLCEMHEKYFSSDKEYQALFRDITTKINQIPGARRITFSKEKKEQVAQLRAKVLPQMIHFNRRLEEYIQELNNDNFALNRSGVFKIFEVVESNYNKLYQLYESYFYSDPVFEELFMDIALNIRALMQTKKYKGTKEGFQMKK